MLSDFEWNDCTVKCAIGHSLAHFCLNVFDFYFIPSLWQWLRLALHSSFDLGIFIVSVELVHWLYTKCHVWNNHNEKQTTCSRTGHYNSRAKEKKRKRAKDRMISMIVGKAKKFRACRMPKYCPNNKWNAKHETNIHRSLIAQNHALNGSIAISRSAPHRTAPKTDIYSIYLNERNETKFINKFNHFPIIFRPFDGFYCSFSLICVLFNFSCSFAFGSTFRGIQFSFFSSSIYFSSEMKRNE